MNDEALRRLRTWMAERRWERFWVHRPENFAWLTGGGDNTVIAGESVGCLEIGRQIVLHTTVIEADRLVREATGPVDVAAVPWDAPLHSQSPNDLEHDLTPLRLRLSPEEQDRFRALGEDAASAVTEAMAQSEPGWNEHRLAAATAGQLRARGIQPIVLLAAGEERLFRYRHPLPNGGSLDRLCMVVVCGRRDGLVADVTRLRSFGHPQARQLHGQVLQVEAAALEQSVPGAPLSRVLKRIGRAYEELGRGEALGEHHQGGIAGYRPRELLATPREDTCLTEGMCVAWNPSLPGAKVEDTFLLTPAGLENLTFDPRWPTVEVDGRARPDIMEG